VEPPVEIEDSQAYEDHSIDAPCSVLRDSYGGVAFLDDASAIDEQEEQAERAVPLEFPEMRLEPVATAIPEVLFAHSTPMQLLRPPQLPEDCGVPPKLLALSRLGLDSEGNPLAVLPEVVNFKAQLAALREKSALCTSPRVAQGQGTLNTIGEQ